jgi:SAM-dependent methyltransferase
MKTTSNYLCLVLFLCGVLSEFTSCSFLFKLSNQRYNAAACHKRISTTSTLWALTSNENDQSQQPQSESSRTQLRKLEVVEAFVQMVDASIRKGVFSSLTLRGGGKKKSSDDASDLRGSIRQVQGRLIRISDRDMLQLTFKYRGATDICKNFSIDEIVKTFPTLILDPLASEWGETAVRAQSIQGGALTTTLNEAWELRLDKKNPTLLQQSPGIADVAFVKLDSNNVGRPETHDRVKKVPISTKAGFLYSLGVTHDDGKPRQGMTSKLRQCQKFVEIVGALVEKTSVKGTTNDRPITVLDMGCGRGYLTFALHSYLREQYENVFTTGIDVRPKLVAEISAIAKSLGEPFDSLAFEEGTIQTVVADSNFVNRNQESKTSSVDILVALHACDTATDDALYCGIARGADLIVVAPCCHKELRSQLDAHYTKNKMVHPMADILRHAVYRERMAETVTDSLRALLLEYSGYKVQVFEFIGGEHTSKNVMITAVKTRQSSTKVDPTLERKIDSLSNLYGIRRQSLAQSLKLGLSGQIHEQEYEGSGEIRIVKNRMPPLR